jgi:hypothetical protein
LETNTGPIIQNIYFEKEVLNVALSKNSNKFDCFLSRKKKEAGISFGYGNILFLLLSDIKFKLKSLTEFHSFKVKRVLYIPVVKEESLQALRHLSVIPSTATHAHVPLMTVIQHGFNFPEN